MEAAGVGILRGIENRQVTDFSRRTKRQKLEKRAQLERIWNTASGLPERVAGRPALSLLRTGLACCCQIVLIKRLPNQGLNYGLAANV